MRRRPAAAIGAVALLSLLNPRGIFAQDQAPPQPRFDVVSVKRNTADAPAITMREAPNGAVTFINVPASTLIARAFPPALPSELAGLPGWANTERYDVRATSGLDNATREERLTMLRALLAERFGLVVHTERRPVRGYDLVVANASRAAATLSPVDIDCDAIVAQRRVSPPTPPAPGEGTSPRCLLRVTGARLEGESTMENLAAMLRSVTGRPVVNKTALTGSFRIALAFDLNGARLGPGASPASDAPSLFTAITEQLGLRLTDSRIDADVIVIDRLERPLAD